MVVFFDLTHVYKYPLHLVVHAHFAKYPNEREKFVQRIQTLEQKIDHAKGVDYKRRIAVCTNVLPRLLRQFGVLNDENILLEEETWLDLKSGCLRIRSRNLTWSKYADMREESTFCPHPDNPEWTQFEQHGSVTILGLGAMAKVLEVFAKQFLMAGSSRAWNIMEQQLIEQTFKRQQHFS